MWTHLYKNYTDPRLCLAFIMKEKGQLEVQDREARSPKGKLLRRQTEQAASKSSSAQSFACPKCNRVCASKIGLLKAPTGMPRWPSAFPNPCLRGVSHRHISFFFLEQFYTGLSLQRVKHERKFISLRHKMVSTRSGKPIHALPRLREVSQTFETVPMLMWLTMSLSRPFEEDRPFKRLLFVHLYEWKWKTGPWIKLLSRRKKLYCE